MAEVSLHPIVEAIDTVIAQLDELEPSVIPEDLDDLHELRDALVGIRGDVVIMCQTPPVFTETFKTSGEAS